MANPPPLAELQAALIVALTIGAPSPVGFDNERIQAAATALADKRQRGIVRTWPSLAEDIGPQFCDCVRSYTQAHPLPSRGGSLADGRTLIRWLGKSQRLSDATRFQVMSVDLSHRMLPDGQLIQRTWPTIRIAWLGESRQLVLAVHWSFLGEVWLKLPRLTVTVRRRVDA